MKNTIKITISSDDDLQQILVAELTEIGFDAFEHNIEELYAYVSEDRFNNKAVEDLLKSYNISYTVSAIQDQNWNSLWESNFSPVAVHSFCLIRAHFHEAQQGFFHDIVITPKMSFGTGHHATTFMMTEEMQFISFSGSRVADFGTGTGILAILAEKLGAECIDAIDYDEWSIKNAEENCITNNCTKIILQQQDYFSADKMYNIILANINKNVITEYAQNLSKSLLPGATLLLSGLLEEDESDIVKIFEQYNILKIKTLHRNGWICLRLQAENGV